MKGRSNYLCLHRYQAMRSGGLPRQQRLGGFGQPAPKSTSGSCCRSSSAGSPGRRTGDRAELRDLPDDLPIWSELSASAENCLGIDVPAVQRVLRHADAAASRRLGSGHRQPPPAVCRRGGPPGQLRRGDSGSRRRDSRRSASARGCRDQLLRPVGQQLPARRPDTRRRARAGRLAGAGAPRRRQAHDRAGRGPRAAVLRRTAARTPDGRRPGARDAGRADRRAAARPGPDRHARRARGAAPAAQERAVGRGRRRAAGRARRPHRAGDARRRAAAGADGAAARQRPGFRLLPRDARPRPLPPRGADRRLAHRRATRSWITSRRRC